MIRAITLALSLSLLLVLGACAPAASEDTSEADSAALGEQPAEEMAADEVADDAMAEEEMADEEMADEGSSDEAMAEAEPEMIYSNFKGKELPNLNAGIIEASDPAMVAIGEGQPQLLDFFGYWCGTCNAMAPEIETTKQTYGDAVEYLHLDVDDPGNAALMEQFAVEGTPTFIVLDGNGEVVERWKGATDRAEIEAALALVSNQG